MSQPELVSVVVAAFNAEPFLAAAIDSILAQDHSPLEVVVVDDGSTDATAEIAAAYGGPVRCIRQPHSGLSTAHNRGLAEVAGGYLAFLDADDLWLPDKTSRQLTALHSNPEIDVVFGHVEQFVDRPANEAEELAFPDHLRLMPGYLAGAMLIRREAFDRVGRFDESLALGPFIDWYARALQLGIRPQMLTDVVMRRRIHHTNMGIRLRDYRGDYVRILKSALDRKRGDIGSTSK